MRMSQTHFSPLTIILALRGGAERAIFFHPSDNLVWVSYLVFILPQIWCIPLTTDWNQGGTSAISWWRCLGVDGRGPRQPQTPEGWIPFSIRSVRLLRSWPTIPKRWRLLLARTGQMGNPISAHTLLATERLHIIVFPQHLRTLVSISMTTHPP